MASSQEFIGILLSYVRFWTLRCIIRVKRQIQSQRAWLAILELQLWNIAFLRLLLLPAHALAEHQFARIEEGEYLFPSFYINGQLLLGSSGIAPTFLFNCQFAHEFLPGLLH